MAKSKEFRYQEAVPITGTTQTGLATYYVDNSGLLRFVRPGGEVYTAGHVWRNFLSGTVQGATATGVTGGASLGTTTFMLPVVGPSGQKWCIPAYPYS